MTPLEQLLLVALLAYVPVVAFPAAWLALRLCRRNYDCPLRRENAAAAWTRKLEAERGT